MHEAVKALALCHNVTPVTDDTENQSTRLRVDSVTSEESDGDGLEAGKMVNYQASSPDEVMSRVPFCQGCSLFHWHSSALRLVYSDANRRVFFAVSGVSPSIHLSRVGIGVICALGC